MPAPGKSCLFAAFTSPLELPRLARMRLYRNTLLISQHACASHGHCSASPPSRKGEGTQKKQPRMQIMALLSGLDVENNVCDSAQKESQSWNLKQVQAEPVGIWLMECWAVPPQEGAGWAGGSARDSS